MADVSVRIARRADAPEIARVQIDTWRGGYAEILPESVLASLSIEAATSAWTEAITAPPTRAHHVLVALEQQWIVGFAVLAPVDPDEPPSTADAVTALDQPPKAVAIGPILVEPRWGRRGHGSRLLAACVDHARTDGATYGLAWLPEADSTSRSFFGSAGWQADGYARTLDTGAGELRELRIHASLI
jgi:GNAT superfamily N-acetyltransferase